MSFLADHAGVLRPEEFSIVRNVYSRLASEPWVSKEPAAPEQFAKVVLRCTIAAMTTPKACPGVA
jgi:hypothetical protein